MKYMGSKRAMLRNGLGEALIKECVDAERFVDLFSGSSAVAAFVATRTRCAVTAIDLQKYGQVFAAAILERTSAWDVREPWAAWLNRAMERLPSDLWRTDSKLTVRGAYESRDRCERRTNFPVCRAYGGHYFSESQAIWIDCLGSTIPIEQPLAVLCLAALLVAASRCSASPGHTAQPLTPSRTSLPFIAKAWGVDIVEETKRALEQLSELHANVKGRALLDDALDFAWRIDRGSVVFVDPPYSAVHYSRFYHVLESIARRSVFDPEGIGRYPPPSMRPKSYFSMKGTAPAAMTELLIAIAESNSRCIVTFPAHECSNGLSGDHIADLAGPWFYVQRKVVESIFSSLGGTSTDSESVHGRAARSYAKEVILTLVPRNC